MSKKVISLFMMDGEPDGRIKSKIENHSIIVYKIPRNKIDESKSIDDLNKSGIYFLIASDDESEKQIVYVGQGTIKKDDTGIATRATGQHSEGIDDYWGEVVFLVSGMSNNGIGQTELCYLENKFYNIIKDSNRVIVKNAKEPTKSPITEEQECVLQEIIDDAKILIGSLGYKFLTTLSKPTSSDILTYVGKKKNSVKARCQMTNDGFYLLKGSEITDSAVDSCSEKAKRRREEEKKEGNIIDNKITKDLFFDSPSAIAQFVSGLSESGNTAWENSEHKLLKDM